MVSTTSSKTAFVLTLLGSLIALLEFWGFGFHYLVASDDWPKEVSHAFDQLSAMYLVGLFVTILALYGLLREERQVLLAWCLIMYGLISFASCYWYLSSLNRHSDHKVPLRTWFAAIVPCALWIAAGVKWINSLWRIGHHDESVISNEQLLQTAAQGAEDEDIV